MRHSGGLPRTRSFPIKRAVDRVRVDHPFTGDMANRLDAALGSVRGWPAGDLFPRYYP